MRGKARANDAYSHAAGAAVTSAVSAGGKHCKRSGITRDCGTLYGLSRAALEESDDAERDAGE